MSTDLPPQYITRAVQYVRGCVNRAPPQARRSADALDEFLGPTTQHIDEHVREALRLVGAAVEEGDVRSSNEFFTQVGRDLRRLQRSDPEAKHPILTIARRLHDSDQVEDWPNYFGHPMELARLKLLAAGRDAKITTGMVDLEIEAQIHDPDPEKCFRLLGGRGKLRPTEDGGLAGKIFGDRVEFIFYKKGEEP